MFRYFTILVVSRIVKYLNEMRKLDDRFITRISEKIKSYHFKQSPRYSEILSFKTNEIDEEKLSEMFESVEEIEDKRQESEKYKK